jgi:creatinase
MDIAPAAMQQRMVKSPAEIALIRQGATVADVGGHAIREAIALGATELEVSIAGRVAMEREIARRFPDAEYRDTGVGFQSGINTDGGQGAPTGRRLRRGDILSLSCVPVISGYCTALRRTLFLGEVDAASLRVWQANIDSRDVGVALLRAGTSCAEIARKIDDFLAEREMLAYRNVAHGQGVGILSHGSGREVALELREDVDTVLEPGMVIAMEPALTIPEGMPGAGGYREHDIFVVTEDAPEGLTQDPCGPAFNVVG